MDFSSLLFGAASPLFKNATNQQGLLGGLVAGGMSAPKAPAPAAAPAPSAMPPAGHAEAQAAPSFFDTFSDKYNTITKNPLWRLGTGLMEQGGPQARPHSFGQDLSRAVSGVQGAEDDDGVRQMRTMQLEKMKSEQAAALQALQALKRLDPSFQDPSSGYNGGMQPRVPQRTIR